MNKISLEKGRVVAAAGNLVRIRLPRTDSCRACGLCLFGSGGQGMILETENETGAGVGDRVEVELERRDPLAAAGILFGLPLLALLAGAGGGWLLARAAGFSPDGGAALGAAVLSAGAFFLVRRRELRRAKRMGEGIRIRRVLSRPGSSLPDPGREETDEAGL